MKSNQLTNARENTVVWILLVYFLIIGLFLIIGRYLFWDEGIQVIEFFFSPDRHLEKNGIGFIDQIILPYIALHLGLGMIGWILLFSKPWLTGLGSVHVDQKDHTRFNLFIISSLLALYLFGLYQLPDLILGIRLPIYFEDSFFETMTAISFFVSGALLFFTVYYVRKDDRSPQTRGLVVFFLFLALMCILIAGEEISWGQRVFDWETPQQLAIRNTKGEINLHNILTSSHLEIIERGAVIIFSIPLFGIWLGIKESHRENLSMIIPPTELFILALMLIVSSRISGELMEEMAALFLLLYSSWIWNRWRSRIRSSNQTSVSEIRG